MSVVAVRINKSNITMAADSIIIHGWSDKTPVGKGKIFEVNGMIIGTAGYASEGVHLSLFAENHTPLDATERSVAEFLTEFGSWKMKTMNGVATIENEYLIAFKNKCFYVSGSYIAEVDDYFAIGAGAPYAEAALYLGHTPAEAVKTACALCCYVDEPIVEKTLSFN